MTATVANKRGWRPRGPKFALALPSIFWYAAFFVAPIVFVVLYSFGTKDINRLVPVDFSNPSTASYSAVFDETFFKVFRGTVRIAIISTMLCLLIGLPVAYFAAFKVGGEVARHRARRRGGAELHEFPHSYGGVANSAGAQRHVLEVAARHRRRRRRRNPDSGDRRRRATRHRLQLPRLHDLAALRRVRPHRRATARGEQRPRRRARRHVFQRHAAARRPGYRRGCAAHVHSDVRRLRDRHPCSVARKAT